MLKLLIIKILLGEEVDNMVAVYVNLIIGGHWSYKRVPAMFKDRVKAILMEDEETAKLVAEE